MPGSASSFFVPIRSKFLFPHLQDLVAKISWLLDISCSAAHFSIFRRAMHWNQQPLHCCYSQIRQERSLSRSYWRLFEITFVDERFSQFKINFESRHLWLDFAVVSGSKFSKKQFVTLATRRRGVRESRNLLFWYLTNEDSKRITRYNLD